MNYNSPRDILDILSERGLSPRKRFGQNFLISKNVREQIISIVDIKPDFNVWEIGPGLGSMTSLALEKLGEAGRLAVFEIDRGFAGLLRDVYGDRIDIVEGDMIKTWKGHRESGGMPDRIFGNLPYNAASAMIASLIEENSVPEKMVFTVQKEVAQRMAARPYSGDYSSFSVICQFACNVKIEGEIKGGAFYPVPDVTSSIVSMTPHYLYNNIADVKSFSRFLRVIFNSRRKTLFNNLKALGKEKAEEAITGECLKPELRADTLDTGQIVSLFARISSMN